MKIPEFAMQNIDKVTDAVVTDETATIKPVIPAAIIEVIGLGKTVALASQPLTLLADINFQVYPGETLAIVGSSGSGKSTLLGLLAGLDQPTQGCVKLLGQDLTILDEDARARIRAEHIGFVFQSFQLLNHLTALENVMLPLELRGLSAKSLATEMLERMGLGARLHHSPKTLSGGEQQRVAIARAFVTEPTLVLADEPTGSLDRHTGSEIIDSIFELARNKKITLILVTHDEKLAQRCTRQIMLEAGALGSNHTR